MAKLAGWASVVNIVYWLLTAIPGFLNSFLAIPFGGIIALGAGILGLRKGKTEERAVGQCVISIFVGTVNVVVIGLVLMFVFAAENFW